MSLPEMSGFDPATPASWKAKNASQGPDLPSVEGQDTKLGWGKN